MKFFTLLFLGLFSFMAHAETPAFTGHVVDTANIISDEKEQQLSEQLNTISSSYVILMTTNTLDGQRIDHYVNGILKEWKTQHPEIHKPVIFAVSINPKFTYIGDNRARKLFPKNAAFLDSLRPHLTARDFDAVFQSAADQITTAIQNDENRFNKSGFPNLTGRIVDAADTFSAETIRQLTALSESAEPRQVVAATVPSLDGKSIEQYANELFRQWGLGDKNRNDGVLLLLAPREREVRIEVGYGLESTLTDALSSVIIQKMIPILKKNDFNTGMLIGMQEIVKILDTPIEKLPNKNNSFKMRVNGELKIVSLNDPIPYEKMFLWMTPFVLMVVFGSLSSIKKARFRGLSIALSVVFFFISIIYGFITHPLETFILIPTAISFGGITSILKRISGKFKLSVFSSALTTMAVCSVPFIVLHPTPIANLIGFDLKTTFGICLGVLIVMAVISLFITSKTKIKKTKEEIEEEAKIDKEIKTSFKAMDNWLKKKGIDLSTPKEDEEEKNAPEPTYTITNPRDREDYAHRIVAEVKSSIATGTAIQKGSAMKFTSQKATITRKEVKKRSFGERIGLFLLGVTILITVLYFLVTEDIINGNFAFFIGFIAFSSLTSILTGTRSNSAHHSSGHSFSRSGGRSGGGGFSGRGGSSGGGGSSGRF